LFTGISAGPKVLGGEGDHRLDVLHRLLITADRCRLAALSRRSPRTRFGVGRPCRRGITAAPSVEKQSQPSRRFDTSPAPVMSISGCESSVVIVTKITCDELYRSVVANPVAHFPLRQQRITIADKPVESPTSTLTTAADSPVGSGGKRPQCLVALPYSAC
jgi:hypothetical protein